MEAILNTFKAIEMRLVTIKDVTGRNATQLALLDQAYTALRESVYDALVVQTRLKPYLDDISLMLDANGNFNLDFAALDTRLSTTHTGNANTAIGDLLDLRRLMGDTLEGGVGVGAGEAANDGVWRRQA